MLMKTFSVSQQRRTCNNGRKGPNEKKRLLSLFLFFVKYHVCMTHSWWGWWGWRRWKHFGILSKNGLAKIEEIGTKWEAVRGDGSHHQQSSKAFFCFSEYINFVWHKINKDGGWNGDVLTGCAVADMTMLVLTMMPSTWSSPSSLPQLSTPPSSSSSSSSSLSSSSSSSSPLS